MALPSDATNPNDSEINAETDNTDADGSVAETATSVLLKQVVEGRSGKSTNQIVKEDGEEDSHVEENTAPSKINTARTNGEGTQRSQLGEDEDNALPPTPYDGHTNIFQEFEYQEADPYELLPDLSIDDSSTSTSRPLLRNDVPLLHADNLKATEWILNINEIRLSKRLRVLMGRTLVRRLDLLRMTLIVTMAQQQPKKSKSETETADDDSTLTLTLIFSKIDEYACQLKAGCENGISLGTWVPPAPSPPPTTPPVTPREEALNTARSKKSEAMKTARSDMNSDDEEEEEGGKYSKATQ